MMTAKNKHSKKLDNNEIASLLRKAKPILLSICLFIAASILFLTTDAIAAAVISAALVAIKIKMSTDVFCDAAITKPSNG